MIKNLINLFKKKKTPPPPASSSERIKRPAERRPVQEYVYPPVASGLPRFPVTEILGEHEELLEQLRSLSEHKAVFDARYFAVITRYAQYVYLLPASEAHHHRGAGGLLRHGLETAKYVLQQTYDRVHGIELSPKKRKEARERWLFAGFTAGLCHDLGKTTGMRVYSASGQTWDPFSRPLAQWFQDLPPDNDRLFVSWRRDGQDHRRMGLRVLNLVITPEDMRYLNEVETFMLDHMHQGILGEKVLEKGPRNHLPEMVQEADRKSLIKDLEKSNLLSDLGPDVGEPLARLYVLAMKRLIQQRKWRANEPGSVLWVIGPGVYLVFPEMAADVTDLLYKDGVPGVPANEYTLAEVLEEHGLLAHAHNGNRLWRIRPAAVNAGEEGLLAMRLKDPRYILDLVPPPAPGEVRGEGEERRVSGENIILFNPKSRPKGQGLEAASGNIPPWSSYDPALEDAPETETDAPSLPLSCPGLSMESEPPQGPQTLADLQEYFAGGGLGGQSLVKFATEVSQHLRQDGLDYKNSGPTLLLTWGERKFTEEANRPEVIESLARVKWLVLNGDRRVHDDPGFGRCLKLREQESTLFWRLVWKLREVNPLEPEAETSLTAGPPEPDAPPAPKETRPQEAAIEYLSGTRATPEKEVEEPEWVSEVKDMLDREGPVDYDRVEELVKSLTGRQRKVMDLVNEYFLVNYHEGRLAVMRRQP